MSDMLVAAALLHSWMCASPGVDLNLRFDTARPIPNAFVEVRNRGAARITLIQPGDYPSPASVSWKIQAADDEARRAMDECIPPESDAWMTRHISLNMFDVEPGKSAPLLVDAPLFPGNGTFRLSLEYRNAPRSDWYKLHPGSPDAATLSRANASLSTVLESNTVVVTISGLHWKQTCTRSDDPPNPFSWPSPNPQLTL